MSFSSSTTKMLCILLLCLCHLACQRQLDYKFRAYRLVLFHPDRAAMILYDAANNRQPQAGSAFLSGEVGQEELFFHFTIDAVPGVGNYYFHSVSAVKQRRGNVDLAHKS